MSLCARHLSVHLAGFDLLRNINLEVKAGQVTAVVGPNGAGKSSLLRALTGELQLSHGEVLLNNRELNWWPAGERAQMLAVLPQHAPLNFPFTAEEVVALGRIPHDSGRQRDGDIVSAALKRLDASYLQKRFYTQMSGGERQRVQLARALAQIWEPCASGERILVLDEPTAAFDLSHQQMTLKLVRELAEQGVAVLLVIHDLNLAAQCADNLLVLHCGEVAIQGAPAAVLSEQLIREVFNVECTIAEHPVHKTPLVIT